jgi:AcrR family transcriptional regulator
MRQKAAKPSNEHKKTVRARAKNCPSCQLRKQVDRAAFILFMEKGYDNTTMRMISEETGFGAGSLYNTFDGKEDILQDIILDGYDVVIKEVKSFLKDDVDPLVAISFPMCVEIYASSVNHRYAELLTVAHHTWPVFNAMVDKTVEWELNYIREFDKDVTNEEMKNKLMINGSVLGRYVFQYFSEGPQDCTEGITNCLKTFCVLFGVPMDGIEEKVEGIISLFKTEMLLGLFDIKAYED